MKRVNRVVVASLVLGLSAVGAQTAHATPITGSISFSDGFDLGGLPGAPSLSIVSDLTSFDLNNVVNVYASGSGTGDFAGTTLATAGDFLPPPLPTALYTTDSGFTFTLTSAVLSSSTSLSCAGGLCTDAVTYALGGVVTGPAGFDPTVWLGNWTANGSCLGAPINDVATCSSALSASWSSSVVATGEIDGNVPEVPEPASLALLGTGLLSLGVARRRRQKS